MIYYTLLINYFNTSQPFENEGPSNTETSEWECKSKV